MYINSLEKSSFIYGPGERYVIWTQGCSIRCKGCWNKEMWDFKKGIFFEVSKLVNDIVHCDIGGITILGGEPLDQYGEILELVKEMYKKNISVILYTGYTRKEIEYHNKKEVLNYIDILISGRYVEEKREINLQWIGSKNQKIEFLTKRYDESLIEDSNYLEIILDEDGGETILGFPKT